MKKTIPLLSVVIYGLISCQSSSTEANHKNDSTVVSLRQDTAANKAATDTIHSSSIKEPNWAVAGIDNPAAFISFFDTFKNWAAAEQADSIIKHIAFPLKKYKNAKAVKSNFAVIFDQALKEKIAKQPANTLFVNANGVMLGDGEIWFNYLKGSYYITAINK